MRKLHSMIAVPVGNFRYYNVYIDKDGSTLCGNGQSSREHCEDARSTRYPCIGSHI